ncbi:MAG: radical SAM protein [DPANN group archaeon]|nr:radical SAM protein [DPANN group archaeon]
MKIEDSKANSKYINNMPKGCILCIDGKKSVLFVTGICNKTCYYCPLSEQRKNTENMWINEKPIDKTDDIFEEIDYCKSKGIGITGGEPLLKAYKVIQYITILKKRYGNRFHIHMYTGLEQIDIQVLKDLKLAGLDELRFHHVGDFSAIKNAVDVGLETGIEIPIIPGNEKTTTDMIKKAEKIGVSFLNLNELEFSDTNSKYLEKKGFELKDNDFYAVKGSEDAAEYVLKWCLDNIKTLKVHYCSASTKYDYQYWLRLKRRAKMICKQFESVTKTGLIRKGVITGDLEMITKKLGLKKDWFDIKNNRIETTIGNARLAARRGFNAAVVLEMPTSDSFDMELTPLDKRGKEVD